MATLFSDSFTNLNAWTKVEASGTVSAATGAMEHVDTSSTWDQNGAYMNSTIVGAAGHVIYFSFKLKIVNSGSGVSGNIQLTDNAGISRTAGGTVHVGMALQGVNPTVIRSWNGTTEGGSSTVMTGDLLYDGKFTIDSDGTVIVAFREDGPGAFTTVADVAIDVRTLALRLATNYKNDGAANYFRLSEVIWTDDGIISSPSGAPTTRLMKQLLISGQI